MLTFKIDEEFRDVLPTNEQRYKDLEAAVLKDGCFTDPFITWNGYIIDGHTRYRIMQNHPELDLKPYEKKMDGEFADRYAVIVWIATHQLSRRNLDLNGFEWAEVHQKAYDAEKKSVGAPIGNTNNNPNAKSQMFESEQLTEPRSHAGETATVLAEKFGMKSPSAFKHSVRTANAMDEGEKIVPGFKDGLKSGAIKASKDSVESILNIKDEDEKKAYVKALANGEKPTNPRKAKPRPQSPEMKEFNNKLNAIVETMENGGAEYTVDDAVCDLNSAEDTFLMQIRFVLTERAAVINTERGREEFEHFIKSVIDDLNELKGELK